MLAGSHFWALMTTIWWLVVSWKENAGGFLPLFGLVGAWSPLGVKWRGRRPYRMRTGPTDSGGRNKTNTGRLQHKTCRNTCLCRPYTLTHSLSLLPMSHDQSLSYWHPVSADDVAQEIMRHRIFRLLGNATRLSKKSHRQPRIRNKQLEPF